MRFARLRGIVSTGGTSVNTAVSSWSHRLVFPLALFIAVAATTLPATPAAGWNCPVHIKSAEDAIKRAEAMKLTPDARGLIAQAKSLVAEAKKHHTDASAKIDHANAMWKARAAQAQAEAAAAISTP
jgi:hypothetical protein